jgi:hypothetical protein
MGRAIHGHKKKPKQKQKARRHRCGPGFGQKGARSTEPNSPWITEPHSSVATLKRRTDPISLGLDTLNPRARARRGGAQRQGREVDGVQRHDAGLLQLKHHRLRQSDARRTIDTGSGC